MPGISLCLSQSCHHHHHAPFLMLDRFVCSGVYRKQSECFLGGFKLVKTAAAALAGQQTICIIQSSASRAETRRRHLTFFRHFHGLQLSTLLTASTPPNPRSTWSLHEQLCSNLGPGQTTDKSSRSRQAGAVLTST